jgi:hypothetical protein
MTILISWQWHPSIRHNWHIADIDAITFEFEFYNVLLQNVARWKAGLA